MIHDNFYEIIYGLEALIRNNVEFEEIFQFCRHNITCNDLFLRSVLQIMKEKLSIFINEIKNAGKSIYKQKYYLIEDLMNSSPKDFDGLAGPVQPLSDDAAKKLESTVKSEEKMYLSLRYTTEAICLS
jgi:hypothetical protein